MPSRIPWAARRSACGPSTRATANANASRKPRHFLLVGLLACALARAEPHQLEFLYINANEGTASGGHAALRFDQEVYHFQHVDPGMLRITCDDFAYFRALYGEAENRSIFGHRIAVSDDTWQILRDGFNRRLLIEDEHFGQLENLRKDLDLLRQQLDYARHPARPVRLSLKGAGLFEPPDPGGPGPDSQPSSGIVDLRERVRKALGVGSFVSMDARLKSALERLQALDELPNPAALDLRRFQPAAYGYAERYADQLSALYAWRVLLRAAPLQPGVLLRPHNPAITLTPAQRAGLLAYRSRLAANLTSLPGASRGPWGYSLLVGMARLEAIDASLDSGHLAVLNLAEPDRPGGGRRRDALSQRAPAEFAAALADLENPAGMDDRAYSRLERSANLMIHVKIPSPPAMSGFRALSLLPRRPAAVPTLAPRMSAAQLAGQLARLEAAERAYQSRLSELYPYHLITANCVTELFHSIDHILTASTAQGDAPSSAAEDRSRRRLGGHVRPDFPNNIPFVAFHAVGRHWNVAETRELASWRHQGLRAARSESGWLAELRESNVLSGRLYSWHPDDAAFLVFSDALPWLGVIGGPINAAVGLGQGVAGIATLPWDGGRNLHQGVKGFLISLPETVFFNIRKGSYPALSP